MNPLIVLGPTSRRLLLACTLLLGGTAPGIAQDLYFPTTDAAWETVDPAAVGWNPEALSRALDVAGARHSSGVVILHRGRLMAERYWEVADPPQGYPDYVQGRDGAGRAIEDVASAQKSVVAVLAGIAQEKGLLSIDRPVSDYLGAGWTAAAPEREHDITLRHLLSMTSGLATDMSFAAPPGTVWLYNTPAYHYVMRVLEKVSGQDRNGVTSEWLTSALGMGNSAWTSRPWTDPAIGSGFSTNARDLARFGLMIQAGGRWQDRDIILDKDYLRAMLSPSQPLNPAYGFLWWLNGQQFSLGAGARAARSDGPLIASAPADLVAMQGAMDRKLYLVPSLGLVVARLGASGAADGESFNDAFWRALMAARD